MIVEGLGDLPVFPCVKSSDPLLNKTPATTNGFYDAKPIEPSREWGFCGVRAGDASGVDCLDVDPKGLAWYDQNFDALPLTRVHSTRRQGVHLLFRHAPGLRCNTDRIAPGVDVRADGGYFIWWPREGLPWEDHPLCEWPDWLLAEATKRQRAKPDHHGHRLVERAPLHCRHILQGQNAKDTIGKLDPTEFREYDDWLRLMMACHAAGIDCEDFVAWSTADPDYTDAGESIRRLWSNLKIDGGITAATLFRALKGEPVRGVSHPPKDRRKMTPRDRARIVSISGVVDRSRADKEKLFWAACRYGECRMTIKVTDRVLEQMLMSAGWASGLRDKPRMLRQIRNGLRIGSQQPNWD